MAVRADLLAPPAAQLEAFSASSHSLHGSNLRTFHFTGTRIVSPATPGCTSCSSAMRQNETSSTGGDAHGRPWRSIKGESSGSRLRNQCQAASGEGDRGVDPEVVPRFTSNRRQEEKEEREFWQGIGQEAPGWTLDHPQTFWFAVANAHSLMCDGALLEEVLRDGIDRANREKRPKDVWLVMEPAFLEEHPGLASLRTQLLLPAAAIVSTNAGWMVTTVKEKLPQAVIGKFKAPSTYVQNPVKSNAKGAGSVIGGGGVWH
eukprot:TRINITY_DN407_c0_g4_i1.p1 TRINITY_DN407_c0_g4~~TRINITY_DN407_c0_g4_i1.p1  ORF type:complete len:260 (-),score=29.50 TRINITY_DN407_c0_g4_i1:273-1052(-)